MANCLKRTWAYRIDSYGSSTRTHRRRISPLPKLQPQRLHRRTRDLPIIRGRSPIHPMNRRDPRRDHGSGATGAIDKLIDILNIRIPADLDARYDLSQHIPADERPVVFIGPYEHHSNELPWRESICRRGRRSTRTRTARSGPRASSSRGARSSYGDRPLKIGSFSRRLQRDRDRVGHAGHRRSCLHQARRALLLGFRRGRSLREGRDEHVATTSPTVATSSTRTRSSSRPHKFIGGPGHSRRCSSPRSSSSSNPVPAVPGGGTVAYVNPDGAHATSQDVGASRGGGHPRDRRVDPGRPGVPAQGVGGHRKRHQPQREHDFIQRRHRELGEERQHPASSATADAWRLSIVSASWSCHGEQVPAPQLPWPPCSTTCSGSRARAWLLLRRALRPPAARHRSPDDVGGVPSARSWVAARASSPAGSGSTSTTSSARTVFEFLLDAVHLVASRELATSCLPDYRFEPDTGLNGTTARADPRPPRMLAGAI